MYAELDTELALFARAAATAAGIPVQEAWWPDVLDYLTLFLTRTDVVAGADAG